MADEMKKQWSEETIEAVDKLCLFDDDLMSLAFDNNIEATEYLLNTIFDRKDMKVLRVTGQRELKNPVVGGRCIKLDIYAEDSTNKVYNVEVQRSDSGAVPERARFYSAMVDTRMLKEKQKFKEIEDSYIIFITQNDVLKGDLPIYHIERKIVENGKEFKDGSHIIYVNGAYKDDETELGKMVHDFGCVRSVDMYSDALKKQVQYYKETEGGREVMCEIFEELAVKREMRSAEQTKLEAIKKMMRNLKLSAQQAMDALEISVEEQAVLLKKLQ